MVPILQIGETLLAPIQSDLTDKAAIEFQNDLLLKINECHVEGVVIDITPLDIVDSYMARILNETASMARLLGTEVVLTGMQPSVALTLVEMGRELIGVRSAMTLEQGLDIIQPSGRRQHDRSAGDPEGGYGVETA